MPEILAPAGGIDNLISGVSAGADAVYMGWGELNARRNAKNFTKEEFLQAAAYCKTRGVKVYMTLNTLVYDREISLVQQALELACNSQVDGIIVQDMGVAALAKKLCPTLPLHGSTQMVVHNLSGALALSELGYSCAVLAREMSKDEISLVTRKGGIPTEVFVHGALCMSISGQCYMSSMIGERSGNRGLCAQACRLPFSANGNKDDYALSLKDACLVPKLKELSSMGVSVLKIEGRMKRPEYVTAAVTACRNSLANKPVDYSVLQSVFSRSGFTSGYYDKRLGRDMFGVRGKDDVTASSDVVPQLGTNSQKEFPRVELHFSFTLQPDI
ncbi:MAG: peptidase U32 family protein, partial [Oscillospiraceae bacterium]